jgi:nucleotide-binding universal stress UspA family protein
MEIQAAGGLRVLWAADGSPHTGNAIDFLRALVLPVAAEVTVLTVAPHSVLGGARPDPVFLTKISESARLRDLAEAKETAQNQAVALEAPDGVSVKVASRWGHPIQEILRGAGEVEADLIVLAAQGHSDLRFVLLGSVAEGVVQQASRPVLIARSPRERVDRVVVGFDGSPAAREAVRFLSRLATPKDAEFLLVQVAEPFAVPAGMPIPYRRQAIEAAHEINAYRHRHVEHGLEAAAKLLARAGRRITTHALSGRPAEILDEIACEEGADLLVIGSGRQTLGPTADGLVRHSHTSVLVVHHGKGAKTRAPAHG